MKKSYWIITFLSILLVASIIINLIFVFGDKNISLGGKDSIGAQTLMGSSSNLVSAPRTPSNSDSTTTDAALLDGGKVIQQKVYIAGLDRIRISGKAIAGTATSTLNIMPMISNDDINYFPLTSNSTSTDSVGTTTMQLSKTVWQFTPGLATTTDGFSFYTDIPSAQYLRLVIYATDLISDANDGVQAWLQFNGDQNY